MNVQSIIGQSLLWAGFLSGSMATVFSLEKPDPWSTINWVWYGVSATVCLMGIVAIRISKAAGAVENGKTQTNYSVLPSTIERLVTNIGRLRSEQNKMKPSAMVGFIDEHLMDDLRDFADNREAIVAKNGMQSFANVMTQFAAGERAINRAWSAAADGYVDEVASCLERAETLLNNAKGLLE